MCFVVDDVHMFKPFLKFLVGFVYYSVLVNWCLDSTVSSHFLCTFGMCNTKQCGSEGKAGQPETLRCFVIVTAYRYMSFHIDDIRFQIVESSLRFGNLACWWVTGRYRTDSRTPGSGSQSTLLRHPFHSLLFCLSDFLVVIPLRVELKP